MSRRIYLVLLLLLVAVAATGVYLRQRTNAPARAALRQGSGQAANCDTPAPPAPSRVEGPPSAATPPPKLPGFAIEAACGTGAGAPKAAEKKK
jgi:hypothetical protein